MLKLGIWVELYIVYSLHFAQELLFTLGYSHETLFIPILFLEIIIHNNIVIENTDTIHNILIIHTETIHYLDQC